MSTTSSTIIEPDLTSLGLAAQAQWLAATVARNRARFGGWRMEDGDAGTTDDAPGDTGDSSGEDQGDGDPDPAGADALGDPGKRALDTMKAQRNDARREAEEAKRQRDEALAKLEGREAEFQAEQQRRTIEAEALAKANDRIVRAEIRAQAAGKLNDPADALLYLNPADFEVGEDGELDQAAIEAAVEDLVSKKPYLAAQGGPRFRGDPDAGARKESAKSIDDQIAEATAAGNHQLAIALKRQKAATT